MELNDRTALYRGTFANRSDAGRRLARALVRYKDQHPVVLALPRGGVPVGFEIAKALSAPLDFLVVRKLRAPGAGEVAAGAIVDGQNPLRMVDESVIEGLHVTAEYLDSEARVQLQLIEESKQRYRGDRLPVSLESRTVILVDEGVTTGTTLRAALKALDLAQVARKVLAVPVAPYEIVHALASEADDLACLLFPADFRSVGFYYADFTPTTDDEVIDLLRKGSSPTDGAIPEAAIRWGM